ncbi:AAA family ATPase [Vibrio alginolyticus]|nr:AAA family ATPase [Vibrio sp. STUT-A16]BDR21430.1 hypothetical protein VspSTUT16_47760 [Vibrio sp. STUT-A16]
MKFEYSEMESDKKLRVVFGLKRASVLPGEVLIYPSFDNWNDFGFKIKCTCSIFNTLTDSTFTFGTYIGFLSLDSNQVNSKTRKEMNEESRNLSKRFSKDPEAFNSYIDSMQFFTMLPSMADYRMVVEALGSEQLKVVLQAINDMVLHKDSSDKWVDAATKSEVFQLGFMRHSEGFFAFNNADSLLAGVQDEVFGGISQELDLNFSLDGFKNQHTIPLKYDHQSIIPKRINVLIGKNGLGKSQALKSFCRAALQYKDPSISLVDRYSKGRPMINRLLAIATPGETQNTFPGERVATQKLYYRRLSLTRNGRAKRSRSINELIIQLVRSDEVIGSKSRWQLFIEALSNTIPIDKVVVQKTSGSYLQLIKLNKLGGEQESLEHWGSIDTGAEPKLKIGEDSHSLSSGQLTFLKFALLCCLYIENGSFVLLDEPETHMHPNMIADFVGLLDQLLEDTGSQALIATHSAYFVREISREQVHVLLKNESDEISIVSPRLRTFGADIESISQFIFDEDVDNRLAEKLFSKVKNLSFEEVKSKLEGELSMSAMLQLQDKMLSE